MSEQANQTEENAVDPNEMAEKLKAYEEQLNKLASTNERLLSESKQYKDKWKSLREEAENKEQAKLTENEQWKELLELRENDLHKTKEQLTNIKRAALKKELQFKVATLAPNARDINDVINALPRDILQISEEDLTVSGIEDAVTYVKEKKPWYFDEKVKTGMVSERPEGKVKEKSQDELINENPNAMLQDALGKLLS